MELFDVCSVAHILHTLTQIEASLLPSKVCGQGSGSVTELVGKKMEKALSDAEMIFRAVNLQDCLDNVSTAKHQWNRPLLDISAACEIAHRLQMDIVTSLGKRHFIKVPEDRRHLVPYMEGTTPHGGIMDIIGREVLHGFPSAIDDLFEVAFCLSADCNTAGVFHLMRVAEVGLRALAADRKAEFKDKPIDQQEWGKILGFLDGVVADLRKADIKKWPSPGIKDVQIRFYSEVTAELRGFNEAWRRHIAHARDNGIYGHDYATSVFKHVVTFMQKLAERISESSTTPEYWTS